MARDVFISHSAKDKTIADAMCATLEASGVRCWTAPRDILPGLDWGEAIIDAIDETRLMILIVSSNANDSHQIKREVERAVNRGKIVIPFRIEDVPLSKSLEYYVSTNHWLDALTPPLESHLRQLSDTVKLLLARLRAGVNQDPVQFCTHCGSQYRKGAPSCSTCGLSLSSNEAQREPDTLKGIDPAGSLEPPPITRPLPESADEAPSEKSEGKIAGRMSKSRRNVIIGATSLLITIAVLSGVVVYLKAPSPAGPISPADIAKANTGSVVYIEAAWKLIYTSNDRQVYHTYIPNQWKDQEGNVHSIVNDGRPAVAAYTLIGQNHFEPLLTDNRTGPPVGGEHSGTGFAVTNDGFILTNRRVGATWQTSYRFPPSSTPGVVITDGVISLRPDGSPLLVAAPTDWVPSETKQSGKSFLGRFEGRNDYLNVTFAKNELRIPAKLSRVSDRHDVAMLKIDVPESVPKVELNDNYETIKPGDALIVLGYPEYSQPVYGATRPQDGSNRESELIKVIPDPTMSVGNIGRVIRRQDSNGSTKGTVYSGGGDAYQLTINATGAGNSGAPVFDDHGRVVGVLFAGGTAGASVTYAVPIRYGKELMSTSAPNAK